jgi:transcriptional regulator with XRE-family HTH domain
MGADAKMRVARRIRARLDELGMTGRELAQSEGKSDAWISGVLKGSQGLQLEDLDWVARKLRLSPSELVRHDDSELRELRPSEMRLLRHYQQWPDQIQERWLRVLDYFAASTPDPESARLLDQWRELSLSDRRRLRNMLERLLQGTPPQTDEPASDPAPPAGGGREPDPTGPSREPRTPLGGQPDRGSDDDRD